MAKAQQNGGTATATTPRKRKTPKKDKTLFPALLCFIVSTDDNGQEVRTPDIDEATGAQKRRKIATAAELVGYSGASHEALKPEHFEDEGVYWEWKAEKAEARAKQCRAKAAEARALGGVAEKAKLSKLLKMRQRIAALTAELAGEGVDVEALFGASDAAQAEDGEGGEE